MWVKFMDNGTSYRARITKVITKAIPFIRKESEEYFLEVEDLDLDYDRYYQIVNHKIDTSLSDIVWHLEGSPYAIYSERLIYIARYLIGEYRRDQGKAVNRMNRLNIVVKK